MYNWARIANPRHRMYPVKEKIVTEPENYYFSSARNYADLDSALDVEVVFMGCDNHYV